MAEYMTFAEIVDAVNQASGKFQASQDEMVKEYINQVYFEMLDADEMYPLFWLRVLIDSLSSVAQATVTGISQANPGVVTAVAHGLSNGDLVALHNVAGMTEVNGRTFKVANKAADTFQLNDMDGTAVSTLAMTAYASGGVVNHHGVTLSGTPAVNKVLSAGWWSEALMKPIDVAELEARAAWMDDATSRPTRYLLRKSLSATGGETNQVLWFHGADAVYKLRLWVEKRAVRLSADADVPLMPARFHGGIVSGAVARLNSDGIEVERPSVWPGLYQMNMRNMVNYNRALWSVHEKREVPFLI